MAAKAILKRVRTLQNKALRAIGNAKYNAKVKPICKKLNILSLDDLIELELVKISYIDIVKKHCQCQSQVYFDKMPMHIHIIPERDTISE